MKRTLFIIVSVACIVCGVGCGSSDSDLTAEDKQKMDKLFKEGIKPGQMQTSEPKSPASNDPGSKAPALNQPTD